MIPFLIGAQIISTGISLFGQLNAAADREATAQKNLQLSQMQAAEIEARQKINNELAIEEMQTLENTRLSGAAARGVGAPSGVGDQIAIHRIATRNMELANRDVSFKVQMLRLGAKLDFETQQKAAESERISAFGNLLGNVASIGMNYSKYSPVSKTTDLAKVKMNDFTGPVSKSYGGGYWPSSSFYGPAF